MQNFEIIVVDDQKLLDEIGAIQVQLSEEFLREHLHLLSFSEEELCRKKVGLLASMLPPWMRDLAQPEKVGEAMPLHLLMPGCPVPLMVLYDSTKRAPSLRGRCAGVDESGCVLQNMWLMAHSLGLGFQVLSVLSSPSVEEAVKQLLAAPGHMKVAFAVRLGHPVISMPYPRVRRGVAEFTHRNHFGNASLDQSHRRLDLPAAGSMRV